MSNATEMYYVWHFKTGKFFDGETFGVDSSMDAAPLTQNEVRHLQFKFQNVGVRTTRDQWQHDRGNASYVHV